MKKILMKDASEFLQIVDEIFGFYLDTTSAFQELLKTMLIGQRIVSKNTNLPLTELDKRPFGYIKDVKQENDRTKWQHHCTQKEFKERVAENGKDYKITANLCIVLIYQYWDYHRKKIAKKMDVQENEIKSDIMADLKYLRNSILKHKGIGNHEIKKCKILKWFKEGDEININHEQFEEIIEIIRET